MDIKSCSNIWQRSSLIWPDLTLIENYFLACFLIFEYTPCVVVVGFLPVFWSQNWLTYKLFEPYIYLSSQEFTLRTKKKKLSWICTALLKLGFPKPSALIAVNDSQFIVSFVPVFGIENWSIRKLPEPYLSTYVSSH